MARTFVVKLTHANDDIERVGVALTVASTAIASGVEAEVWLMHEGVHVGAPGVIEKMELPHAPPLIELWNAVVAGGKVFACTQCMMRRGLAAEGLREGVTQAGAPALVASLAEDGAQAIDF
jgi:predicted peroxiredoxin